MTVIILSAKSSSGDSYDVTFVKKNETLSVSCDCQAGVYGKLCKHKLRLLLGDESMLYDPDQVCDLTIIRQWVIQSEYDKFLSEYTATIDAIEEAKRIEIAIRHKLERVLRAGIPLSEV